MNREVLQNILLVVFGLALILVGYVVFTQFQTMSELSARIDAVSQSVTDSSQRFDDALAKVGAAVTKMEEQTKAMADNCSSLGSGWARYESNTVNMSFCVHSDWGGLREELENLAPEAAQGRLYHVTFSDGVSDGPVISYSSKDFRRLLDSDAQNLDWSMIDFTKSEADLATSFAAFEGVTLGENERITVTKTTVAGKDALKVESQVTDQLSGEPVHFFQWFIPNAVSNGTYNLQVYSDASTAPNVQLLIDSMKIN